MGGDTSKFSGIGSLPRSAQFEADFSGSPGRHPPISSRSLSVPARSRRTEEDATDDGNFPKDKLQRHRSTMVVVSRGQEASDGTSQDPLLKKLEELHFFYPLMHDVERRSGLFGTHNRKALTEIQSKVKYLPALKIVRIYEDRLRKHADRISAKQGELSRCTKETDSVVNSLFRSYGERTKATAKCIDRLAKLDDLKRNLSKCQESLDECIAITYLLNDMLPEDEQLEPFSPWIKEAEEEASECIANS